eukprot:1056662-Alexandrium_andersonii.AAC.1
MQSILPPPTWRLTWLLNKKFFNTPILSWPSAALLFRRRCDSHCLLGCGGLGGSCKDYLVADDRELDEALRWASSRP